MKGVPKRNIPPYRKTPLGRGVLGSLGSGRRKSIKRRKVGLPDEEASDEDDDEDDIHRRQRCTSCSQFLCFLRTRGEAVTQLNGSS